jgi:hypothetical protein
MKLQAVLGIRIRTFLQDPDPEIFHRIRIPDPDPTPLKVLIIEQIRWFFHNNISSTLAFHQTLKKTSELFVKTT